MAARHEVGCYEKKSLHTFLACKGLSNDDVRVASGTVFQVTGSEPCSKNGDFVDKTLGGLSCNESARQPLHGPQLCLHKQSDGIVNQAVKYRGTAKKAEFRAPPAVILPGTAASGAAAWPGAAAYSVNSIDTSSSSNNWFGTGKLDIYKSER